ncbi:MAG: hypothetical protein LC750_18760 [Actinobacteria bacterium]|nr:hypothetical protein [Actinomycetota bacterium]
MTSLISLPAGPKKGANKSQKPGNAIIATIAIRALRKYLRTSLALGTTSVTTSFLYPEPRSGRAATYRARTAEEVQASGAIAAGSIRKLGGNA